MDDREYNRHFISVVKKFHYAKDGSAAEEIIGLFPDRASALELKNKTPRTIVIAAPTFAASRARLDAATARAS